MAERLKLLSSPGVIPDLVELVAGQCQFILNAGDVSLDLEFWNGYCNHNYYN